jgi:hypothetical protein
MSRGAGAGGVNEQEQERRNLEMHEPLIDGVIRKIWITPLAAGS